MRRKEVDPEGYRVYGLGEWGEVAGLILKNYVVEEFDCSPERFDYMVNAQDFGFNHANCIGEVGFKDGDLYLCRELYVYEMDTDEIVRLAERAFFFYGFFTFSSWRICRVWLSVHRGRSAV